MKIGLFTDTYYPQINGVATSVLMLKENLEKQGHCVYVFTTTDPDAPAVEFGVYRVPSVSFNVRRLGTFINPRLGKIIKGLGLDLIHTHTEFSLGIFGRSMARALEIPLVHTMHTIYEDYTSYIVKANSLEPFAKAVARKLTASFCNSADEVIVPTNKVKDLLLSYGVNRDISVIPTGISLDKFSDDGCDLEKTKIIRSELKIAEDDKVLINIGRISEEKSIDEILLAMKSYLPKHQDVKLLLVGDGPAKSVLETMAAEFGIQKQVVFAGARPWDEIGLYYKLGNILVSASQSETQGLTYIEALASGLPVVAKEDRCLEGVLQNGTNGYAFHGKEDFLQALDSILNSELQEQLSLGAVRSVKKFSAAHFANTVKMLYEKLLLSTRGEYNQAA